MQRHIRCRCGARQLEQPLLGLGLPATVGFLSGARHIG